MRARSIGGGVLALAVTASAAPAPIVGGQPAIVGQFPTVVPITITFGSGFSTCTGTVITKDWVLTAAHCVSPAELGLTQTQITGDMTIQFGTVDTRFGVALQVVDTIPDPLYMVGVFGSHDLGLVKLAIPEPSLAPLPINFSAGFAPVGTQVTTVGFGDNQLGFEYELVNTSVSCAALFDEANTLCFPQADTAGIGGGDSGGPSFAVVRGHLLQVGVTSFVHFANPPLSGIQRVDAEVDFILAHVPELDCTVSGCPGNLTCEQRTCVAHTCAHDSDCADQEICFDDACIATPHSPTGLGSTCQGGADCDSGLCLSVVSPEDRACTTTCVVGAADACPSGFDCLATPDLGPGPPGACWPQPPNLDDGGCNCDARNPATPWLALAVAAWILRRRRG